MKVNGKKLYELGRKGQTAEDVKIESREVVIYDLKLLDDENIKQDSNDNDEAKPIQKFRIQVECGGGTYIRSLVRDIGIELETVATMTSLKRTKQGQFLPEHCLQYKQSTGGNDEIQKDENGVILIDKRADCNWTVETITEAIRSCRKTVLVSEDDGLKDK